MTETITVAFALERVAAKLDSVTKELYLASEDLEQAEEIWEERWDQVAQDLAEDLREAGSTRSPSEHLILTTTRRKFRDDYHAWRRAKRRVERAEQMSRNRRAEASAYQTMFNNLGAEAEIQDYLSQRIGS